MADPRWQRAKELFQAVVERPIEERSAFLDAAAGGDEALRREVESLLKSDAAEKLSPNTEVCHGQLPSQGQLTFQVTERV